MPKGKSATEKGKRSQRQPPAPDNRNVVIVADDEEPEPNPAPLSLTATALTKSRKRSGSKESPCELPDAKRSKYYNGECTLCGEELGTAGGVCATKCGHIFCEDCLLKHLQTNFRCPKCKKRLEATRPYHPLYLK